VTFDDGWLDNLTIALPILEKHNVPATIFVASSVLDAAEDIWWHDIIVFGWNSGLLGTAAFADFRYAIGLAGENPAEGGWPPGTTLLDVIVAAAPIISPRRVRCWTHQPMNGWRNIR
jgi:Polysaccharide deacetylase